LCVFGRAAGKRRIAQRSETFVKMVQNFLRYGADPRLKRSTVNSTWYDHRLLAEAERVAPGFCRECDEERKRVQRFTVADARKRAQKVIADAKRTKDEPLAGQP
jgi:hypothetical protein